MGVWGVNFMRINEVDEVKLSNMIAMWESENLSDAEREKQISSLCSQPRKEYEIYEAVANNYLDKQDKRQAFQYFVQAAQTAHQVYQNEHAFRLYTRSLQILPDSEKLHVAEIAEALGDVAVIVGKFDKAIESYVCALEKAQAQGATDEKRDGAFQREKQAVLSRKIGEVYEKQGDCQQAKDYFTQGLSLLGNARSRERARIYNGIGMLHFNSSEYSKAELQFYHALELLYDIKDDDTFGLVYKNLGNVYYVQGWLNEAVKCYEKSLSLGERTGDVFIQSRVLNNLGIAYQQKGDLDKAINCYQASQRLKESIGDIAGLAPLYSNLGMLYSRKSDPAHAIEYCQKSLDFALQTNNQHRVAQAYLNLGAVYAIQGKFVEAISNYQKSLQIGEQMGDLRVLASIYINLADAYCSDDELDAAHDYYNRTLDILKTVDIPEINAQSQYVLGLIRSKQGRWDEAIEAYRRSSELFEKIFHHHGVELSTSEIGRAFLEQMNQKGIFQTSTPLAHGKVIGHSKKFIEIGRILAKVADSDATILIRGESGTGKSMLTHLIHENSPRKDRPIVEINCGAIPEDLLESELFGHERGAFTGAVAAKPGKFELADGGTIFFDEIGDMSLNLQVKLLRVLQEGTFERVGGTKTQKVDVRVIAATNQDMEQLLKSEQFREDLYYRINVISITVPPLRERQEDIPLLTEQFVRGFCEKYNKPAIEISPDALELLMQYPWYGNVRELKNVIHQAVLMTNSDIILPEHLPESLKGRFASPLSSERQSKSTTQPIVKAGTTLKEMERELIKLTLEENNYNVTHSAKMLGISRRTLQHKRKKYDI